MNIRLLGGLALGMAARILAGMIGIGGGLVIVPALVYFFKMHQHTAQGTSLAILLPPSGLFAFIEYYRAGHVDVGLAIMIAIGVLAGGLLRWKLGATTLQADAAQAVRGDDGHHCGEHVLPGVKSVANEGFHLSQYRSWRLDFQLDVAVAIFTGHHNGLRIQGGQRFALRLRYQEAHLADRVLLNQLIDTLQQPVHSDALGGRHVDDVGGVDQALALEFGQQVELVHHEKAWLVVGLEFAQDLFHLGLLFGCDRTGYIGYLQ